MNWIVSADLPTPGNDSIRAGRVSMRVRRTTAADDDELVLPEELRLCGGKRGLRSVRARRTLDMAGKQESGRRGYWGREYKGRR